MEIMDDGTVFLPLPEKMWRPVPFGCECTYCKAHPNKPPMWDTLAGHPDKEWTWVVHYPELAEIHRRMMIRKEFSHV